jgi:hypothetical protein
MELPSRRFEQDFDNSFFINTNPLAFQFCYTSQRRYLFQQIDSAFGIAPIHCHTTRSFSQNCSPLRVWKLR